jgi:hypothetical protein
MAYTIRVKGVPVHEVVNHITERLSTTPFTARLEVDSRGRDIIVKPVRLRASKLYCGQHPGECLVGAKRKSKCLDWDDWAAFHGLINDALDDLKIEAEAWTTPMEPIDKGRKMWVRRDNKRRERWDWHDDPNDRYGGIFRNVNRIWNHGSPDQFSQAAE